jgi:hypothetical protein
LGEPVAIKHIMESVETENMFDQTTIEHELVNAIEDR